MLPPLSAPRPFPRSPTGRGPVFWTLCLLLLPLSFAAGQDPTVVVSGRVVDARSGEAVASARIGVLGAAGSVPAGADGAFRLRVGAGAHALSVAALGYRTRSMVLVVAGDTALGELRLEPDPVELQAVTATVDRIERFTRSIPHSVAVLGEREIAAASAGDARQLVVSRMGASELRCPPPRPPAGGLRRRLAGGGERGAGVPQGMVGSDDGSVCIYHRGRTVRSRLFVDGRPALGGYEELRQLSPREIFRVVVVEHGVTVHVFTRRYVEAQSRRARVPAAADSPGSPPGRR